MNTRSDWGATKSLKDIEPRLSKNYPELASFFREIDYWEIKEISSEVNLRQFVSGLLGYMPWWVRLLFIMRQGVARILGLKTSPDKLHQQISPESLSFHSGDRALFFYVCKAEEENYWIAESAPDKHLAAWIGVVTLDEGKPEKDFLVITLVRYKHWIGPLYFRPILPFHHLIVNQMMKAAASNKIDPKRKQ